MQMPAVTSSHRAAAGTGLIVIIVGAVVLVIIGFAVARAVDPPRDDNALTEAIAGRVAAQLTQGAAEDPGEVDRFAAIESAMAEQAEKISTLSATITRIEERLTTAGTTTGAETASADAPGDEFDDAGAQLNEPPVAFDPPELDFGFVALDEELTGTFAVRNISDDPVRIVTMKSDCKCTTVEDLTGRVIEPGESLEITAVVEARSYPGPKESQIRFLLENHRELLTYRVRSHTTRQIYTEPSYFDAVKQSQGVVRVASLDGQPFRILAANGSQPDFVEFEPEIGEPRSSYQLQWDFEGVDPETCRDEKGNEMRGWWIIETDHPEAPLVDVRVRHGCTYPEPPRAGRRWVLSELRMVLDEIPAGESREFEVDMEWLRGQRPDDTIQRVESESAAMAAELLDVERNGEQITAKVRITPAEDHRGLLYGDLRFYGYRAEHSAVLTVIGRVVDPREQADADGEAGRYASGPLSPSGTEEEQ